MWRVSLSAFDDDAVSMVGSGRGGRKKHPPFFLLVCCVRFVGFVLFFCFLCVFFCFCSFFQFVLWCISRQGRNGSEGKKLARGSERKGMKSCPIHRRSIKNTSPPLLSFPSHRVFFCGGGVVGAFSFPFFPPLLSTHRPPMPS